MQSNICYKCQRQEFEIKWDILNEEEYNLDRSIEPIMKKKVVYNGKSYIINLPVNEAFNCPIPEFKQVFLSKHEFIVGNFPKKGIVCYFHDGKIITLIS